MELAFVISALRRRFWVVTLFAVLGALPGLRADPVGTNVYQSEAKLSVVAPTRANVNVFSADPDRYVLTQLAVLNSESLAVDVAARVNTQLGEDLSVAALRTLVEIEQEPETDIVTVITETDNPERAQAISKAYVDLYMEGLATTVDDESQRAGLEARIAELQEELAEVDAGLQAEMASFLPRGNDTSPIPQPEMVNPGAVSQRAILLSQLQQLTSNLTDLEAASRLRVNTDIIANPELPSEALPPGGNYLLAGGLAAGVILGVVIALLWARFSTKVLDEISVGEILGAPVASEFPHYRSIARNPLVAFQALPRSAVPTVDQLCVRAEALARIGEPLTVLVAGTMRSSGSSTLALAMAERFAAGGASVVLVDADVRDPRITALFNATADGGVPSVISNDGAFVDQRGRSAFTRTMDPAVAVLGLGPNRGSAALRRDTVPDVLDACRRKAEIVVVDGGPVLDLASTIQFAALADAVVLAVPLARQKADSLTDMGRQLESVRGKLLPVITSPSRRPAKGEVVRSDGAIAMPSGASRPPEASAPAANPAARPGVPGPAAATTAAPTTSAAGATAAATTTAAVPSSGGGAHSASYGSDPSRAVSGPLVRPPTEGPGQVPGAAQPGAAQPGTNGTSGPPTGGDPTIAFTRPPDAPASGPGSSS